MNDNDLSPMLQRYLDLMMEETKVNSQKIAALEKLVYRAVGIGSGALVVLSAINMFFNFTPK